MSIARMATLARRLTARTGAPVVFTTAAGGVYDPATNTETGAVTMTVAGSAIRIDGDPLKYQALELIPSEAPTLLFTPDVLGELPALGSTVTFGGLQYVVRDVDPVAPDGRALGANVVVTGGGPIPLVGRAVLVLGPVSWAGTGTQRFRGSAALTSPPVSIAGAGDNGIFLVYTAGDALPAGSSYTGPAGRTYTDASGVVQTAGLNVLRDGHYIGGVRTVLVEGARTNSVLWSRDLTNAAWSLSGTGSRTQNAVGLDGTANSATTVADTDATAFTFLAQTFTVPVDANTHTVAYWIRKDTDLTRFVGLETVIQGGTAIVRQVNFNTQTGAFVTTNGTGTGTTRVVDVGLWWVVEQTVTNNSTAFNTSLVARVYPAVSTTFGTNAATATGSCVVGYVGVERNASFMSSPIFTTTVAVTRSAENFSLVPPAPQPLTLYLKGINLGTPVGSGFLEIGSGTALLVLWNNANVLRLSFPNTSVTSDQGVLPAIGDTYEMRAPIPANGVAQTGLSLNGATETLSTATGANTIPGAWGNSILRLGAGGIVPSGFNAFQSLKIVRAVKSLALTRTFTS